ncbi:MAG: hypothetical protein ACKOFH_14395 [Chthoniobacterales bacterium]
MKYSLLTLILWVMAGVGAGFGVASMTRTATGSGNAGSEAAEDSPPIDSAPIVSIAALDKEQEKGAKDAKKAPAAAKKKPAPAPAKKPGPPKAVAALVKQLDEIRKAPPGKRNQQKETELFDEWVELDPAGASAWAAEVFANGGDETLLRKALRGYARRDPEAAATWAASLASPLVRDSALREVFETWSARDPRGAGEMVARLPIGTAQSTAAAVVAKHYANVNFEGALGWMGSLAAPIQGAAFQTIMRAQWARTGSNNPGATLPWLLSQSSVSFREQGIRFIAGEWAKRDPLSALAYSPMISHRPDRNLFLETALRTYTQTNPREAALWLANQPPSSETERLMNQVMAAWTAFEPQETARWAGELPNPALRAKSITSVAESWAKVDPDGLVAWLGGLSDSSMRDAAVEGATRVWMRNDPATAAQWATGIVDRGRRDHNISLVVREWKNHDLAAAIAFVQTTPSIDDNLRRRLLR